MKTDGARSPAAQLKAMAAQWPDFQGRRLGDGTLVWRGPLRPKARLYKLFLFWKPGAMTLPYVMDKGPSSGPQRRVIASRATSPIPNLRTEPLPPQKRKSPLARASC